jgi:hypothetical protein
MWDLLRNGSKEPQRKHSLLAFNVAFTPGQNEKSTGLFSSLPVQIPLSPH